MTACPLQRVNVLGVGVTVLNMQSAVDAIRDALARRQKGYICVTGVHGVSEAQTDADFRRILNKAFLCTPDGMPLVWVGRGHGHRQMDRVYGPDLMLAIMELSEKMGWRHFFYGGANGAAAALRERMARRFPNLLVTGIYEPPFRPLNGAERDRLKREVAAAKPDIFWVGLSTPKQEKFMAEFLPELDATLMIGVGAAFDFHGGRVKQAPSWMQRSGLEWLFRLCCEPRRLWKRYFKNNPLFILRLLGQSTGLKRYSLDA